ncbi:hypothetical protein GCM10009869_16320 [Amnibacterium kyonggiense]
MIRAPRDRVVAIARDPALLPQWAGGLAQGEVAQEGEGVFAVDSPMGRVRVVFTPPNDHGVLDHDVTLPDGSVTRNPFRVLEHPTAPRRCSRSGGATPPTRTSSATRPPWPPTWRA